MGRDQADAAQQAAWNSSGERSPCSQWHFLGPAIRSRHGAICRMRSIPKHLAKTASFAGGGLAWSRIIDALGAAHDAAVQMIDTSIVRVHQHGACITRNGRQPWGGLTSKIHAVLDANGLPVRLALTAGGLTTIGLPANICLA